MRCAANDSLEAMSEAATGSRTCEKSIKSHQKRPFSMRFGGVSGRFGLENAHVPPPFGVRRPV